ncbi:hypothetical protein FBU31_005663, partial [Coemansia sp. 'formosensis']
GDSGRVRRPRKRTHHEVLDQDTGSTSGSNRCIRTMLETTGPVPPPAMAPDSPRTSEDQGRANNGSGDHSPLASPVVVAAGDGDVLSDSDTVSHKRPRLEPCHLDIIRATLASRGLSGQAIEQIIDGSAVNTHKAYDNAWRKWVAWCYRRNCDPVRVDRVTFVNYCGEATV